MGAMFNYEGDAYVDLEFEIEVRDAEGNDLDCDAECDGYGKQITVTLDPRYKINDTDTPMLKYDTLTVYDDRHNVVGCSVETDPAKSEIKVQLNENYVDRRSFLHESKGFTLPMCRIEDEEARLYVQGVDIVLKKSGDDNVLVLPKEALDRLKSDLRKELIAEITSKLFD